ncbi:V-type ATPase subunit [Candidatus Micrarchaeota archaeon]|nr:V-type ATPase subunit [Candidatus Micrarchaeota archaeon]
MALPIPKIESRALKYGYASARVNSMKGALIDEGSFDEMIRVRTVDGMMELLQRTTYKNDFADAGGHTGSQVLEIASARNFSRTVAKILRLAPRGDVPAVKALLRKWDLLNMKMLIHARMEGLGYLDIKQYLFNVGGITPEECERIMKTEGDELFNELKKTQLGREMLSLSTAAFSKNMRDIFNNALKNMNTFVQLESILDAYTYLFMDKGLVQVGGKDIEAIRRVLRMEIDAKNILIIERLKKHGFTKDEIPKYLIKGGTLRKSFIDKLMETSDTQALLSLIRSRFGKLEMKEGEVSLTNLEIALEKALAAEKTAAFHRSILSLGVVLGFVLIKEEEMNNLRKIAKAKEFNIPEPEVREMLVIV